MDCYRFFYPCFSRIIAPSRDERCGAAVVPAEEVVMAKRAASVRLKLVEFDEEWQALDLLGCDSMKTFQELADEAFRDLLRKYDRPTDLKAALKQSARSSAAPYAVARRSTIRRRRCDGCRRLSYVPSLGTKYTQSPKLTARFLVIPQEPSNGEERNQDNENNPNIDAHQSRLPPPVRFGSRNTAMIDALGTNSCSIPSSLAAKGPTEKKKTPVILLPGLLMLATRPTLTGSAPMTNTIGVVAVTALPACAVSQTNCPPA
jgi:hypothetical protein